MIRRAILTALVVTLAGCSDRDPQVQANACMAESILHKLDAPSEFKYVQACMEGHRYAWNHADESCRVAFLVDTPAPHCFYDPTTLHSRAREIIKKLR